MRDPELLTIDGAAHFANSAPWRIYYWIKQGHLRATKLGRDWVIDRGDLEECVRTARRYKVRPRNTAEVERVAS
jgi:excisionase family DNA binding protein